MTFPDRDHCAGTIAIGPPRVTLSFRVGRLTTPSTLNDQKLCSCPKNPLKYPSDTRTRSKLYVCERLRYAWEKRKTA